jgi:heme ABC exporter ATP-binding subunit CcmA
MERGEAAAPPARDVGIAPSIECVDVVAVLGGFPVLAGASLRAIPGEILLLRGPNGAGKTSLLRVVAGLLPVHRGQASVMGIDLASQPRQARRHVGMLGHANGLYGDLTVAENVAFWGATVGASVDEITGAMVRMGLADRLADVPTRKLSAGQKRRTALACVIARRAGVWLLDEPHSGLDATGRDELDAVLTQAAAAGATIVISSHDLDRGTRLADRVITVRGGVCQ